MNETSYPAPPPPKEGSRRRGWLETLVWIGAVGGLLFLLRPAASGPKVGTQLDVPRLTDLDSGERLVPKAPGRPLLVEVFASWCTACRRSAAMLSEFKGGSLDFVMVSVDETIEGARSAREQWPITARVLHDSRGELHRKFDIHVLPTFVLLDESGVVVRVTNGAPGALDLHAYAELARKSGESASRALP